jgi:flagellar protein FlaG
LARNIASTNKISTNASQSRVKAPNSTLNKSSISNKTLAETLKTNEEKVRAAVKEINNELVKLQSELGFSVDKVANDVVVTVKRKESGEIVRQIPSETALKLAHNFEKLKGVLLDEKF